MIQLENISKSWDGGRTHAVRDVHLEVPTGTVLALLGGSGSGKSTTVKMINRLIDPTGGRILLDGEDLTTLDPVAVRRRIGYVFQGVGLFPHLTVADNVAIVPRLLGRAEDQTRALVGELLAMIGLPLDPYGDRLPNQLSGGQRQRVGFARALAAKPSVMLLDEPFGALDPVTRNALQTEFLRLRREFKLTAVVVTHDMAEALLLADHIAVMRDGRVLRYGTPRELMHDPGDPYVESLLSTPRRHARLIDELESSS
jgi:osmoprotectant transport system ATP-binding protein